MATSANFAITELTAAQANKTVTINTAIDVLDDFLGRLFAIVVKTASYTVTKTDKLILSNHSAAVTYTLPTNAGVGAARAGQVFVIKDRSAGGASVNNITIAVPTGVKLDGTANGTKVLNADKAVQYVVFDGTDYWLI